MKNTKTTGDRVITRIRRGALTELRLESGAAVFVRPFAPVGEGDCVLVAKNGRDVKIVLDDGQPFIPQLLLQPVLEVEKSLKLSAS